MRYPNLFSKKTASVAEGDWKKSKSHGHGKAMSNNGDIWARWPVSLRSQNLRSSSRKSVLRSASETMEDSSNTYQHQFRRRSSEQSIQVGFHHGQQQPQGDEMSAISNKSHSQRRNRVKEQKQRRRTVVELQRSVPFDVYVPNFEPKPQQQGPKGQQDEGKKHPPKDIQVDIQVDFSRGSSSSLPPLEEPRSSSSRNCHHQNQEPPAEIKATTTNPSSRPDLSLEDLLANPSNARELDPESRARLQAIRQLSSMMGPDHPDVLFSMEYLGKHLQRRGNVGGAKAIQNHIHQRYHAQATAKAATNRCV